MARLANIHPEVSAYIKAQETATPVPHTLEGVREFYTALNQRFADSFGPELQEGVVVGNTIVPAIDGYQIPIRTYKPTLASAPVPLIISIHGGGSVLGSLTDEDPHCRLFVKEFGASCVNIDYSLSPEVKIPTHANDCWDVLIWCLAHLQELNADPAKGFIVTGVSAGASLADNLGHLARDAHLNPPLTGLLEIAPNVCHHSLIPAKYANEFPELGARHVWLPSQGCPRATGRLEERCTGGEVHESRGGVARWPCWTAADSANGAWAQPFQG